jgi:Cu(I)/Ag(I) efflux system protein CusF
MKSIVLFSALLIATATGLHAQTQPAASQAASSPKTAAMTEGEVRKIDKAAEKVTLRHAPIDNLGMPAMTMVFKVADPKMLDTLKEGDKIRFSADKLNGAITVTGIEAGR